MIRSTGHLLELVTGNACAPQVPLQDVVNLSSNRGVLAVVEWSRVDGFPSDGGDRVARYFDEQTFGPRFTSGNAGGATAATAFQASGGLATLEVGNDVIGGYTLHPTGGHSRLPCKLRDSGALIRRGRGVGDDLFAFVGDCGSGLALFISTKDTYVRGPDIADAGDFFLDVGVSGTQPVVAVMRLGATQSELEVTRYELDAGVSRSRRFQFIPQVTLRAMTIDDFDQPVIVLLGASTVQVTSGAAVANLTTSSALSLLHLDANLNPVRFAALDYPTPLSTRALLAVGNALVIDVACSTYDGGTSWPCPSNRSSFAMRLMLEDGGTP